MRQGAAEDLDPSRSFSTRSYLLNYPDIAASGANPLVHYIEHGQAEGRSGESNDYQSWIERFDTLTEADRRGVPGGGRRPCAQAAHFDPDAGLQYRTGLAHARDRFRAARSSIPTGSFAFPTTHRPCRMFARRSMPTRSKDARIRVVYRDTNGHISANTNSALALATGDYVALLDADDELTRHALFWVANEIASHPDADLIYSDEDKIDVEGRRFDAYFKPDWNPALILSQNFFCHLGVYRRSLVEKVGGFRVGFEGSQDHDLVLRCAELTSPERIRHIPRVLYHWRAAPGSTASTEALDAKPYAWRAGATAIEEHLRRRGIDGKVEQAFASYYQIDVPRCPPRCRRSASSCRRHASWSCSSRSRNRCLAARAYSGLRAAAGRQQERIRGPRARPPILKSSTPIRGCGSSPTTPRPFNYSWLNNWAASRPTGSVLCFMNDDIEVITPDWLEKLVARLQLDGVGAVGPMLYYPDDRVQHAGVILGVGKVAGHSFSRSAQRGRQDISAVPRSSRICRASRPPAW